MRLNSSELYLSLMLETFETAIVPELQSATAQLAGGVLRNCMMELLRREGKSQVLLAEANRVGWNLVSEMRTALDGNGVQAGHESIAVGAANCFATLAQENEVLTAEMTLLSRRLGTLSADQRDDSVSNLLLRAARWEYRLHADLLWDVKAETDAIAPTVPLPRESLQSFIQTVHEDGDRVIVKNMQRAEGGSGKQTYLVTLVDAAGHERDLVVRKSDKALMVTTDAYVIEREFHLLSAVAATGFPAPKPLWFGKDVAGTDGDFFIMERLPGKVPGTFLGGTDRIPEQTLLDLAALLARLHNIKLERFSDYIQLYDAPAILFESIEECYRRMIAKWRQYVVEADQRPSPALEYLLDWLTRHIPENTGRPVLVHGDFNIHNILVSDGQVSGMLDWESGMFGAPEQDLAYIQPHISRHIDWNRFVSHYLQCGGKPIDAGTFDFYQAVQAMRVLSGLSKGAKNLQTGATRDIRLCMVELGYFLEFMKLGLGEGVK